MLLAKVFRSHVPRVRGRGAVVARVVGASFVRIWRFMTRWRWTPQTSARGRGRHGGVGVLSSCVRKQCVLCAKITSRTMQSHPVQITHETTRNQYTHAYDTAYAKYTDRHVVRPWTSVRKCERKFAPPTQRKALRSSYPRAMVPGRLFPNRRWAEYLDEWQDDPARRGAQLTNASAARSHSPDRSKCKLRLCIRACGILRVSRWMRGKEACTDSRWLNVLLFYCKNPRNLEHVCVCFHYSHRARWRVACVTVQPARNAM